MQKIWARTAQTRCTCKCALCHFTTAPSHGPTSSALKRRVRFRDVFTIFYSTVLASAAVADTSRKDARLQKWESRIQEARNELRAIEDDQRDRVASLLQNKENDTSAACVPTRWQTVFDLAKQKMGDREALGFQDFPGPPLNLLQRLDPSEIQDLLSDPVIASLKEPTETADWGVSKHGNPDLQVLSEKKVKTMAWSIRKLSYQLLESSKTASANLPGAPYSGEWLQSLRNNRSLQSQLAPIRSQINICSGKLRFLRATKSDQADWQRFEPPISPIYHRVVDDTTLPPNRSLRLALASFATNFLTPKQQIKTLLSDISTILLNSRIPPDINFFNNLMMCLIRLQRWLDVKAVIESMRESHIRPNKRTLTIMLRFYTMTEDIHGFTDLTLRMKGERGGLAIVNPNLNQSHDVKWRFMFAERFAKAPSRVVKAKQRLHDESIGKDPLPAGATWSSDHNVPILREGARMNCMDSSTYAALIEGTLKLIGPKAATTYYLQMIEDGWNANIKVLGCILDSCLRLQNWEGGVAVWKQICDLAGGVTRAIVTIMLELCRCQRKHIEFGQVLDYGVRNRVFPPSIWYFPEEIAKQAIPDLIRRADLSPTFTTMSQKIRKTRDDFGHSLESLAYRIAETALDMAELYSSDTAFNVYVQIRITQRNGPRRELYFKKAAAFQRLAKLVKQDKFARRNRAKRLELQKPLPPIQATRKSYDRALASLTYWRNLPLNSPTPSSEPWPETNQLQEVVRKAPYTLFDDFIKTDNPDFGTDDPAPEMERVPERKSKFYVRNIPDRPGQRGAWRSLNLQ